MGHGLAVGDLADEFPKPAAGRGQRQGEDDPLPGQVRPVLSEVRSLPDFFGKSELYGIFLKLRGEAGQSDFWHIYCLIV
jgi:hypothetical protein